MKARVPAFDALEPGDLAIVPGSSLSVVAPGSDGAGGLVEAFARARVPALLLVEAEPGDDAFGPLEAAAADAGVVGLPDRRTPTRSALERSVIGFLVNRRAELDHRAAELEGQLARLALLGRGLDALAAAIGSFLGRAVVVEGRRGDAARGPRPGRAARGGRRGQPRTWPGPAGGGAARADPGATRRERRRRPARPPRASSRRPSSSGSPPIGSPPCSALELARDVAVRQARDEARRGDPLPRDGPPWIVLLARQAAGRRPRRRRAREETRAELRLLASPRRLVLRGTSESLELRMVAATGDDDPDGR